MPRLSESRDAQALAAVTYRSRAVHDFSDGELCALLESARSSNGVLGVTGVLLYDRCQFFQCIEGPQAALTTVMNRVRRDPRHREIRILAHHHIPSRLYPGWSMHFARDPSRPVLSLDAGLPMTVVDGLDDMHAERISVQTFLTALSVPAWYDASRERS